MFSHRKKYIVFCVTILLLCPITLLAYGIKTGFGKVVLDNVPIGVSYSMRDNAKFPLTIENDSDKTLTLKLSVIAPSKDEIQQGYEAIPGADWIKLEKEKLVIASGEEEQTDVVISIPDDKNLKGRKFHVYIWSHTTEESLGVGIKSKLLINIEEK